MKALAVAVAVAVSSACEIARPADLHPDAVALYVLLVPGEEEARMLAVHPHRDSGDPAPDITATLEGPGWTAPFADTLERKACYHDDDWVVWGSSRCLRAALPDTIRPGAAYRLRGTAPLGSFTGEMTVPGPPLLLEPADSQHLAVSEGDDFVRIPMRYLSGPDIGVLIVELLGGGYLPRFLDAAAGADTVRIGCRSKPQRLSLRLVGIGWHYARFTQFRVDNVDLWLRPWPAFGIEGEGVYGYFDGLTPSRSKSLVVAACPAADGV